MRRLLPLLVLALLATCATAAQHPTPAATVIEDYLKLPFPADDPLGEARSDRLSALDRLKQSPDDVPAAIGKALPDMKDPRRRDELIECLRSFPTKAAADICVTALGDQSAQVRGQAIQRLRMFARRVDRVGPTREQRGATWAKPAVEGLTPHLIKAADDPVATNRMFALYALADSLEPEAVARLRAAVKDADAEVRFPAAALLTEFDDALGLPELKAQLARLLDAKAKNDSMRFFAAGRLIASFERLTGKSFGKPPMNPVLSSDSRQIPKLEAEYDRLLEVWSAWWAWEPGK
jgi:HEAT repeat protein